MPLCQHQMDTLALEKDTTHDYGLHSVHLCVLNFVVDGNLICSFIKLNICRSDSSYSQGRSAETELDRDYYPLMRWLLPFNITHTHFNIFTCNFLIPKNWNNLQLMFNGFDPNLFISSRFRSAVASYAHRLILRN